VGPDVNWSVSSRSGIASASDNAVKTKAGAFPANRGSAEMR
jgi:hypothetical protein